MTRIQRLSHGFLVYVLLGSDGGLIQEGLESTIHHPLFPNTPSW